jgi:hypothetical protein
MQEHVASQRMSARAAASPGAHGSAALTNIEDKPVGRSQSEKEIGKW